MKKIPESKNLQEKKILDLISNYLKSGESIVTQVLRLEPYNDYPKFYQFATQYLPTENKSESVLLSNGASFNKEEAYIKAVMETIERWYLNYYEREDIIFSSFSKMRKNFNSTLDPKSLTAVSKNQLRSATYREFKFNDDTDFFWTKVKNISEGSSIYVPAQLIYKINEKKKEPILRISDSTGAAAGTSIDQALYKSICEIIERDAYTIFYHNNLPVKRIDVDKIPDKRIRSLISHIRQYFFDIELFDITLDIKVPVFFSLLIDKTNVGPKISVGAKCDLSWKTAAYGAIMESLQGLTGMRDTFFAQTHMEKGMFNQIKKTCQIPDRILFWFDQSSIKILSYLLSLPHQKILNAKKINYDPKTALQIVLHKLSESGIKDIYWKKITPQKLDKFGLVALKVLIPELEPMPHKDFLYLGGKRLYNIPVKLGFRRRLVKERDINKFPHPLP